MVLENNMNPLFDTNTKIQPGFILHKRYKVLEIIGQGGMGIVFKAFDSQTKSLVCIKHILASKNKTSLRRRFQREYHFLSQIDYPHIVKMIEVFEFAGEPFLVMEFIEGISLDAYLKRKQQSLSFENQLAVAIQLAKAVQVLNTVGILHRDIKPANIILNEAKQKVVLLDLGLAKNLKREEFKVTLAGDIIGTPEYMSPEQVNGYFSPQSDIFSLGVTLYQLFTGMSSSPFKSQTPIATMTNVAEKKLPLLHKVIPQKGKAYEKLGNILAQCLEKDETRRLQNIAMLIEVLEQIFLSQTREKSSTNFWNICIEVDTFFLDHLKNLSEKYGKDRIFLDRKNQRRAKRLKHSKMKTILLGIVFIIIFCFSLFLFESKYPTTRKGKIYLLNKLSQKKKSYYDYKEIIKLCDDLGLYSQGILFAQEAAHIFKNKRNLFLQCIRRYIVLMNKSEKMSFLAILDKRQKTFLEYKLSMIIIDEFCFYEKGITLCNEALNVFLDSSFKKDFFMRKIAHYLFLKRDYFRAEIAYEKIERKTARESFYHAISLHYLKEYRKAIFLFSKINRIQFSQKEQDDFAFYYGASLTLECFQSIGEFEYLRKIKSGQFEQNKLKNAKNIFQKIIEKNPKCLLYLGYCHIGNLKKAEQYFLAYKTFLGERYKKDILLLKGLGIIYFCKEKLNKSITQFQKCSQLTPWKSLYFHLTAQVYAEFPKLNIDRFYTQCVKALRRAPYNLHPIYTLTSSFFKTKEFTKIFIPHSFLVHFIKTEQFHIKPDLWEKQKLEISRQYLREVSLNITRKKLSNPDILLQFYLSKNLSRKKFAENIFVTANNKKELITYLEKEKNRDKHEEIEKLIAKIRTFQGKENEKYIRSLMVRFVVGHDVKILKILEFQENIQILQQILLDKKERMLVRYWAAITLSKVRKSSTLQYLFRLCRSEKIEVKLLCMAALSSSGFTAELTDHLGYIKNEFSKRLSFKVLAQQNEKILALFLHNTGKHLKEHILEQFLNMKNEKINIITAKCLLQMSFEYKKMRSNSFSYKKKALSILAKSFESFTPIIRAYAFYWFRIENFDTVDEFQDLINRDKVDDIYTSEEFIMLEKYKRTLFRCLKKEPNYKVRAAIAYALKNYRLYERLESILTMMEAYHRKLGKFQLLRESRKHILKLRRYIQSVGKELSVCLNKEKNGVVQLHIVNTMVYLEQLDSVLKYIFNEKKISSNKLLFFQMVSLRLGFTTGDKLHSYQNFNSISKDIKALLKNFGPMIVFSLGRLGCQDVEIPSQVKYIFHAFIIQPLKKALNFSKPLIRMVAGYSSIMVENDNGILLKHLIGRYQKEQNEEVKHCMLPSIIYMAEKYNLKAFRKYSHIIKSSSESIRKIASYGHYYHVDKWSTYEWLVHFISGVNRYERNELKLQYFQKINYAIMAYQYLYQKDRLILRLARLEKNWKSLPPTYIYKNIMLFKKRVLRQFEKMKKYRKKYPSLCKLLDNTQKEVRQITVNSRLDVRYWRIRRHYKELLIISILFTIIDQLDKAIDIYPSSYYFYTKAYFLDIIGNTRKAITILDRAIQANQKESKEQQEENSILYLYTKIKYLIKLGDYKQAYRLLKTNKNTTWERFSYLKALSLMHINRKIKKPRVWRKALEYLHKSYISKPYSAIPIIQMAHIHLFQNNTKKAEKYINLARKLINKEDRRLIVLAQATDGSTGNTMRNLFYEKSRVYLCEARLYIQRRQIQKAMFAIHEGARFCKRARINNELVSSYNYYRSPFTQNNLKKYPEFRKYPRLIQHLPKSIQLFYDRR